MESNLERNLRNRLLTNPNNIIAYWKLGAYLNQSGRYSEAEKILKNGLELLEASDPGKEAELTKSSKSDFLAADFKIRLGLDLAESLAWQSRFEESLKELEKIQLKASEGETSGSKSQSLLHSELAFRRGSILAKIGEERGKSAAPEEARKYAEAAYQNLNQSLSENLTSDKKLLSLQLLARLQILLYPEKVNTAEKYFKQARDIFESGSNLSAFLGSNIYKELGFFYKHQKNIPAAALQFAQAYRLADSASSLLELSTLAAEAFQASLSFSEKKEIISKYSEKSKPFLESATRISEYYPELILSADIHNFLAQYCKEEQKLFSGRKEFEKSLQAADQNLTTRSRIYQTLASLELNTGFPERALQAVQSLLEMELDPAALTQAKALKAQILMSLDRDQEALQDLKEVKELTPDKEQSEQLSILLGECYYRLGYWKETSEVLESLAKKSTYLQDPEKAPKMLLQLAQSQQNLGSTEQAIVLYDRVKKDFKNSPQARHAQAQLKMIRSQIRSQVAQGAISEAKSTQLEELLAETLDQEGLLKRLQQGLSKTREGFISRLEAVLESFSSLDQDLINELEETLILSDLGVATTRKLMDKIEHQIRENKIQEPTQIINLLKEEMTSILISSSKPLEVSKFKPYVILVLGVNGVGKTTTIAKLAYRFQQEGKKVILGAADTFRAAAIEQLEEWGQRVNCPVIKHQSGSDPSAVAFDTVKAAIARELDVVIIDTAGRLHTKSNLMEELKKIRRVLGRELEGAPHEVLLVLDATTGQNALSQAKLFHEAMELSGLILTKLDGTAKGGIILAISQELNIPVKLIGVGEKMVDLQDFQPQDFISALFSSNH